MEVVCQLIRITISHLLICTFSKFIHYVLITFPKYNIGSRADTAHTHADTFHSASMKDLKRYLQSLSSIANITF